jgi:hypothetical protein
VVPLTPEERVQISRMGAHALHSRYDSRAMSQPARDAFMARFEDEVDPGRILPEEERKRRAEHAKKLYFTRLAHKSAKARAKGGDAV